MMTSLRAVPFVVLLLAAAAAPAAAEGVDEWKSTFVSGTDMKAREKAGIDLAMKDPDSFALAVDEIVKAKKDGDAAFLAKVAVKLKVRHVRLLLVWAVSLFGPEAALPAFLDRIDNDYPMESARAAEALGFLRIHEAMPRLMDLLRSPSELISIQAARAVGRAGAKGDAMSLVDAAIAIDSGHVRTHLAWAVQDLAGGKGAAQKMFAKYIMKQGTQGFRAKEACAVLEDGMAVAEEYKVKLETIRGFFGKKGGSKLPPIEGPKEESDKLKAALAELQKKAPAWYHLLCCSVGSIRISGAPEIMDHKKGELTLRFVDVGKWDRSELWEYYLVRYSTIMFMGKMGDPCDKHRGWEEGMMEAWWYAMDHTQIALDEDLNAFIREALKNAPW